MHPYNSQVGVSSGSPVSTASTTAPLTSSSPNMPSSLGAPGGGTPFSPLEHMMAFRAAQQQAAPPNGGRPPPPPPSSGGGFAAGSPAATPNAARYTALHDEPKPQHSYIGLIAMALLSTHDKKMVLSDIYQWILDNYPYFRSRGPGWRNSIRHNLSLNDCFVKAGRSANGKGHYWAIHPANLDDFIRGDFRRRRAQRKVRRHMGLSVGDDEDDSDDSPCGSPLAASFPGFLQKAAGAFPFGLPLPPGCLPPGFPFGLGGPFAGLPGGGPPTSTAGHAGHQAGPQGLPFGMHPALAGLMQQLMLQAQLAPGTNIASIAAQLLASQQAANDAKAAAAAAGSDKDAPMQTTVIDSKCSSPAVTSTCWALAKLFYTATVVTSSEHVGPSSQISPSESSGSSSIESPSHHPAAASKEQSQPPPAKKRAAVFDVASLLDGRGNKADSKAASTTGNNGSSQGASPPAAHDHQQHINQLWAANQAKLAAANAHASNAWQSLLRTSQASSPVNLCLAKEPSVNAAQQWQETFAKIMARSYQAKQQKI